MKNKTLAIFILIIILVNCSKDNSVENPSDNNEDPHSTTLFNEILFYDGYSATVEYPVPDGVYRISNSKYVTKISQKFIEALSDKLNLEITVKAACDNYDRIGNVFLSFVNKDGIYDKNKIVNKIEIARFITPFMDKNRLPNKVPYNFEINNIAKLLSDSEISGKYDFWIEFDIFGVPYAANNEIPGCQGMNFTFFGSLKLSTTDEDYNKQNQYLIPIASSIDFNNYSQTDVIGQTTKTFNLEISSTINSAKLYLITSNHGSNAGGEEYIRRNHYVYFDGNLIATYKPGGKSCEPFRQYNTQGNGIYGSQPRTEAEWTSWNNWCPGDVIPIRVYDLGNLDAGNHTFKIEVPDAKFVDAQGNFPLSAYIQGDK
ncbi:MAG: hypothetical protein IPH62_05125 [Ignavibacteriae bacterium]|nr:hypothetical protein [Ignavibacteriota bacterium]